MTRGHIVHPVTTAAQQARVVGLPAFVARNRRNRAIGCRERDNGRHQELSLRGVLLPLAPTPQAVTTHRPGPKPHQIAGHRGPETRDPGTDRSAAVWRRSGDPPGSETPGKSPGEVGNRVRTHVVRTAAEAGPTYAPKSQ